jgi:hypothetical protein
MFSFAHFRKNELQFHLNINALADGYDQFIVQQKPDNILVLIHLQQIASIGCKKQRPTAMGYV